MSADLGSFFNRNADLYMAGDAYVNHDTVTPAKSPRGSEPV